MAPWARRAVSARLLAAAAFACGWGRAAAEPTAPMTPQAPLVVGLSTPLSGRAASIGRAQREALEQAIADIAAGAGAGVHDPAGRARRLALVVADDGCSRAGGERAAAELTAAKADVVIGYPCPSAAAAAVPLLRRSATLLIAAGNRHPGLGTEAGERIVFRSSGRDDRQGRDGADRLAEIAGPDGAIAILHDRTSMARSIVQATERRLAETRGATGTSRPLVVGIVAGETDYAKALDAVAGARPAAVLFAGFPAEAAILLRRMRARGIGAPLLLTASNATGELAGHAGATLGERVEIMLPIPAGRATATGPAPLSAEAIAAADARSALAAWLAAGSAARSFAAAAVARELVHPSSPRDTVAFDDRGDAVTRSFAAFVWKDGGWRAASH